MSDLQPKETALNEVKFGFCNIDKQSIPMLSEEDLALQQKEAAMEYVKLGLCHFDKQSTLLLSDDDIINIQSIPIQQHLQNDAFTDAWKQIFKKMKRSQIEKLVLNYNKRETILKEISFVEYTNLENIHLAYCEIRNIEVIAYAQMPKLKELFIHYNHFISMKSMRKAVLPSLKYLVMNLVYVADISPLTELHSRNLTQFRFEATPIQQIYTDNIAYLAKIESSSFNFKKKLEMKFLRINYQKMRGLFENDKK